jgi:2-polyprenyl-3-methyl-5-hydroxy-6-metoxy-1,4-benzoquinol methylase
MGESAGTFKPHKVEWTREKGERFWSHFGAKPVGEVGYWSKEFGGSLLAVLQHAGMKLSGRILDFGCGHGHLMQHLAARGLASHGADFSRDNVAAVNGLSAREPLITGADWIEQLPTTLADDSFDIVFFVETIEHLLDGDLERTMRELRRLLRPGGTIVITTPNDENLAERETICPDCGCVFHAVQHVRAWTSESLDRFMTRHGFANELLRRWNLQRTWPRTTIVTVGATLLGLPKRNLVYVGRKV